MKNRLLPLPENLSGADVIVLGIDPAIRTTGYGVIRVEGTHIEILDCGTIVNSQKLPHSECVRRIYGGIAELIAAYHPDAAAVESPFAGRNASTAIILGMARGALLTALSNAGVAAFSYTPSAGKQAATGRGSATKEQVAVMLASELGISIEQIPLDSTDALALAICHAQRAMHPEYGKLGNPL